MGFVFFCVQPQNAVALRRMREVYADSTWSKEKWSDLSKDSSLVVNMDILKTNTLKIHIDPHNVFGRPTLKDVESFRNRLLWARSSLTT